MANNYQELLSEEVVQERNHPAHFVVSHCLVTWQAQFLCMNLFRNWKRKTIPIRITCLLVGGYRIVNDRAHSILCQICLQSIPFGCQDWEYMIDTTRARGELYQGIADLRNEHLSNLLPTCIILIKVL